jgi:hypothetical protein
MIFWAVKNKKTGKYFRILKDGWERNTGPQLYTSEGNAKLAISCRGYINSEDFVPVKVFVREILSDKERQSLDDLLLRSL